jgi:GTP-dependent dephospho-CoA kinase
LLALPLFSMASEGSAVLYGQPLEGLVIVKITEEKQKQARDLIDRIWHDANLLDSIERFKHKQGGQKSRDIKRSASIQQETKEHK